jgi:hypothetical protein
MSTTSVESAQYQLGRITFTEPDNSQDPMKAGFFSGSVPKSTTHIVLPLHNIRDDVFSEQPVVSLETHGFTAVKHRTALLSPENEGDTFMNAEMIEKIYVPEVEKMIQTLTGARKIVVIRSALRSKSPESSTAKTPTPETDKPTKIRGLDISNYDVTRPTYNMVSRGQIGPAREAHLDYSPKGIRSEIRQARHDLRLEAEDIINAEDQTAEDASYQGRRYAVYSVWRPLKTVTRDPLAVCDPNSVEEKDFLESAGKRPGINGPYPSEQYYLSGQRAERQRWFWIKDQQPDEVLILQFFDSHARKEGRPIGVAHGSPELVGVENDDWRESFEVRCVAFW